MDRRKRKKEKKTPTFTMKITRRKIDEITQQIAQTFSQFNTENQARAESLLKRISNWPRIAADVSKERREEIRIEGGKIIADYNYFFKN